MQESKTNLEVLGLKRQNLNNPKCRELESTKSSELSFLYANFPAIEREKWLLIRELHFKKMAC